MSEMSEVAPRTVDPETGEVLDVTTARGLYNPDLDFRKLVQSALFYSRGFRLIEKDQLINVPHGIVTVTYREGYLAEGIQGDYVSCESVVASQDVLDLPQVRHTLPAELTVWPNQSVIYNDGGTGIRRTLTQLFHESGLIDVGGDMNDERRFDRPFTMWDKGSDLAQKGITASDFDAEGFLYAALMGLRRSDYPIPEQYGKGDATTWYFG